MTYYTDKTDVVQFVEKALDASNKGSALTMTIGRDKSGVYFAHIVIDELSGDIEENMELIFFSPPTPTSTPTTPVG